MSTRTTAPRSAGTGTLLRLALAGGRSDRLRIALTMIGAALATAILLLGATIASIRTSGGDGPYTINLINESGLRPGVLLGLAVLAIPVVVFVGLCTRVGAPARDRRLAMFRMAGATPEQVTRVASYETGIAAGLGAVVGTTGFLVLRALLDQGAVEQRTLPTDVAINPFATIAVVATVIVATTLSSALAMRQVRISAFGVKRSNDRKPPGRWAAVLFVVGAAGLVSTNALLRANPDLMAPIAVFSLACFVLCLTGILLGGASFATMTGKFLAPRTSRPVVLIASRRMIDAPYTSSRATASVLLAVFIGSAVQGTRANFLTSQDPADTFYRDSFDLINIVLVVAIVIAAASLVVTASEAIVERRRTLAALTASGTPRSVIARSAILETLTPLVPAVFLATATGTLFARSLWGTTVERLRVFEIDGPSDVITVNVPVPWAELALLGGGAITIAIAATLTSLAFLPASTAARELRAAA